MIRNVATVHKKTERGLYARQCETNEAEEHIPYIYIYNVCRTIQES